MHHKSNIHHLHDKSYKDLFSQKEIAIDLFKNVLKKDWSNKISKENLKLVNKSFVTSDYKESECDLVYEAEINENKIIFYILLEFQSTVDYRMPLRLLFYMCEILREYTKNRDLKRHDKNIKVPAILPIVLYNGENIWDVPTEFRKIIYNQELFGNNIINFNYHIIDINNGFTGKELIENKNVSAAIFLLDQKIDVMEFLYRVRAIALMYKDFSKSEQQAIKHWINNTIDEQIASSAIKILESDREDVEKMVANNAFIVTEMKEKAMEEGRKEGLQEGRKEGIKEGIKEGRQEGLKKGKTETILGFIKLKFSNISPIINSNIKSLSEEQLEVLSKMIIEVDDISKLDEFIEECIK